MALPAFAWRCGSFFNSLPQHTTKYVRLLTARSEDIRFISEHEVLYRVMNIELDIKQNNS
jgi:hypothetical protein